METFKVRLEDDDESDSRDVRSTDAAYAASEFVRERERRQSEYPVASGEETPIVVVVDERGVETTWVVSGWAEPTYLATATRPADQEGRSDG